MNFLVGVITADSHIAKGSAVVFDPDRQKPVYEEGATDGSVFGYFEGNIHGASNLVDFADKARVCAGRMHMDYPTAACGSIPLEIMNIVGEGYCDEDGVTLNIPESKLRVAELAQDQPPAISPGLI